jgi:hypothetical protein
MFGSNDLMVLRFSAGLLDRRVKKSGRDERPLFDGKRELLIC